MESAHHRTSCERLTCPLFSLRLTEKKGVDFHFAREGTLTSLTVKFACVRRSDYKTTAIELHRFHLAEYCFSTRCLTRCFARQSKKPLPSLCIRSVGHTSSFLPLPSWCCSSFGLTSPSPPLLITYLSLRSLPFLPSLSRLLTK